MTPTAENRQILRRFLNEKIPFEGVDSDTRFLDTEIDQMITDNRSIEASAAQGWQLKAGMVQEEMGDIAETQAGAERYKYTSLLDRFKFFMQMAAMYEDKDRKKFSQGSVMLKLTRPEVI